jgi:N-sulfoglucosamine sulfohydrolase
MLLKKSLLIFLASISAGIAQPNIVLIIADDMAWDDSGTYGNPNIPTPNIDKLAAEGMRFNNAFLTASSCSPSRCSIITGRYPHNTDAEELHWPLPGEHTTFVEKLKEGGYWTAAAGKWHLGDAVRDRFDEIRETDTSGFQLPTGAEGQKGKFIETMQGEAQSGCTEWIPLLKARPKDKPFFLWLAALDPHRPYHKGIIPNPTDPAKVRLPPYHVDLPEVREDYALYYDEIIRLDRYVGDVVKELDAQNISNDTLILFISDNGRPFPRDKTTIYDSGIKTPFIVRWPAKVKPGSVTDSLISTLDIAPTFLALANQQACETFQGTSFAPILEDPTATIRPYIFAEQNWHDYEAHSRAARTQRFKYIRNAYTDLPLSPSADGLREPPFQATMKLYAEGKLTPAQSTCLITPRPKEELYDCQTDPHEITNLILDPAHHEALNELQSALDKWEIETADYAPVLRTADEFDRIKGLPTPARVRPRLSKAEMVAKGLAAGDSLRATAARYFQVGVGVTHRIVEQPDAWPLLLDQFSVVTPENCMKVVEMHPEEDEFRFQNADKFVAFAEEKNLQIIGHTLVWAKDDRTPEWMFKDGDKPASKDLLLQRMKTHIDTIAGRYKGKIHAWDVVNEALDDGNGLIRPSGWLSIAGEDYLVKAFEYAHAADPNALLFYNDYNNESPNKRKKMITLIKMLKEKGAPIHGCGIQGHYTIDQVPYDDIESTLNAMRDLGMKVVVSELDIDVIPRGRWWADGNIHREEMKSINPFKDSLPADLAQRQADQYAKLFALFKKHADIIERITFWNLHDGQSWLNHFPWERTNHPLLFDRNKKAKPAFQSFINALK